MNETQNCHICGAKGQCQVQEYTLCKWCNLNITHFIKSKTRNILWGSGRIDRGNWVWIKKLLKKYEINTLLEFGTGLSTELFSLEGFERMVSCDILELNIESMKKKVGGVEFIHYGLGHPPEFGDIKFDMVFVDGPSGDRSRELDIANRCAEKVIYCHDWGRGQTHEALDSKWKPLWKGKQKWAGGEIGQHIFVTEL